MTKYFDKDETLVASELWDFLSGDTKTMEQILEIINTISTVDFLDKYDYLIVNANRSSQRYKDILAEWFLSSELELIENDEIIRNAIVGNRKLTRIYNKQAFESNNSKKGTYRFDRYNELKSLL